MNKLKIKTQYRKFLVLFNMLNSTSGKLSTHIKSTILPPIPSDSSLSTATIVCLVSLSLPPPPRPCSSNVPVLHYSHVPSHASFFSIFFVSHAPPINSCLYHKSSLSPTSPLHVLFLLRDPPPPLPTFSFFFSHPFTILFRSFVIFFLFFFLQKSHSTLIHSRIV